MDDMTIFNLRVVNKGALKATVSIRLGSGLTIHDCKIIQQDGALSAALPQRSKRQKGGEVVYYDLNVGRLMPLPASPLCTPSRLSSRPYAIFTVA